MWMAVALGIVTITAFYTWLIMSAGSLTDDRWQINEGDFDASSPATYVNADTDYG